MRDERFVRMKNEITEILLTTKQMIFHPLMMILYSLWMVITFQQENFIKNAKKLAEQDRNNSDHQMPNETIQGSSLTVCKIIFFLNLFKKISLRNS